MPIHPRLPRLRLDALDELIAARKMQHGGQRGAPRIVRGERVGAAINKSCILMLSALMQGYVEDVFVLASARALKTLRTSEAQKSYRKSFTRWGNPSAANIDRLFSRIGLFNPFDGIAYRDGKIDEKIIRSHLEEINQLRNRIAHGQPLPSRVALTKVIAFREFADRFGRCFGPHVMKMLQMPPRSAPMRDE